MSIREKVVQLPVCPHLLACIASVASKVAFVVCYSRLHTTCSQPSFWSRGVLCMLCKRPIKRMVEVLLAPLETGAVPFVAYKDHRLARICKTGPDVLMNLSRKHLKWTWRPVSSKHYCRLSVIEQRFIFIFGLFEAWLWSWHSYI